MRTEMNPLRTEAIGRKLPPDLPVVAIITHLPEKYSRYHADRLDIVLAAIKSAHKNAGAEHYFAIWDNGSGRAFCRYIADEIGPDLFVQSVNVGKQNAMRAIYGMFPGAIVSISDDDILHYPGWLDAQIKTLLSYPASIVSGVTTRFYMTGYINHGTTWAKENQAFLMDVKPIPQDWDKQHAESVGQSPDFARAMVDTHAVEFGGVKAWLGSSHCQFVARSDEMLPLLTRSWRYMQPLSDFDRRIDEAGILRLLTFERSARHIGNVATEADKAEMLKCTK